MAIGANGANGGWFGMVVGIHPMGPSMAMGPSAPIGQWWGHWIGHWRIGATPTILPTNLASIGL